MKKLITLLLIIPGLYSITVQAQTSHQYGTIIENQAGGSPIIYMGQNNNVSHRYLGLINSTTSGSAGGLMAGGVLVADTYSYATPGRNDLIVKGRVGIGTNSLSSYALDVTGNWAMRSTGYFYDAIAYAFESSTQQYMHFKTTGGKGHVGMDSSNDLILQSNGGQVGINTTAPAYPLDVNGGAAFRSSTYFYDATGYAFESSTQQYLHFKTNGGKGYVGMDSSNDLILQTNGGKVGIGTTAPGYLLSVDGTVNAEEVIVSNVAGADFVFEEDYDLRSLEETEKFIEANKHLPEIPSAADMAENGLGLKEMNILLLQKVEELTLHLIEQNKRIDQVEQVNSELAKSNEVLKAEVHTLKNQ